MRKSTGAFTEWMAPLAFIACAAWVIWYGASFIMAFGGETEALAAKYRQAGPLDFVILAALPVLAVIGAATVRRADMEYEDFGVFDRLSIFIGRVTMLLIALLVCVMFYEVVLRYAFERPTLWANELSLWMAGFVFMFAGLYAMQQRSHIRIFLLYDLMPRWLQKVCDTISTLLIVVFAAAVVYGGYGEASAKFLRWELYGTAFDPPLPATTKPAILIVICLVALQAVSNLFKDWSKEKEVHLPVEDIDVEELTRGALGDDAQGGKR
ncbi:MAG: TRAP transporter small permease subunit [Pseudomonadota bacterium]